MEWIQSESVLPIVNVNLSSWKRIGDAAPETEVKHCDPLIFTKLQTLKIFYNCKLTKHEASSARSRLNPYELIENGPFQNRAGMKLANIDADLGFILSNPRNRDGSPSLGPSDTLYFVDVCGGPGGFSEYMLYRKGFEAKGFGITLRNSELDYNMGEIQAGPVECLEVFYGQHNNGNIYDPANVKSFVNLILLSTENVGAHTVVADGGIEMERGKNFDEESVCKQLYLSQALIGLSALREGGAMVCKLFETQSDFTVGLLYLIHLCFEKVTVYKPRMSRPQNAERYLVCVNKRRGIEPIIKYLTECHQMLWEWSTSEQANLRQLEISQLVPLDTKKSPAKDFLASIRLLNNKLARDQVSALTKLREYVEDPKLRAVEQNEVLTKCYEEWKVPMPEERRVRLKHGCRLRREMTEETYDRLCRGLGTDVRSLKENVLVPHIFEDIFRSPFDWRVVVVQGNGTTFKNSRGFYMSQGGTDFFRYNITSDEWEEVPINVELPKDTLLYGECVTEFHGFGAKQRKVRVFHIIDVLFINGKHVGSLHCMNRYEILKKLVRSVNKASRADLAKVRAKCLVRMENIAEVFKRCQKLELLGETGLHWTCHADLNDERSPLVVADGLLFLKMTKDPWMMSVSRSSLRKYWYHTEAGTSLYELPRTAIADFSDTMSHRVMWKWNDKTNLEVPENGGILSEDFFVGVINDSDHVNSTQFLHFLHKFKMSLGKTISPRGSK